MSLFEQEKAYLLEQHRLKSLALDLSRSHIDQLEDVMRALKYNEIEAYTFIVEHESHSSKVPFCSLFIGPDRADDDVIQRILSITCSVIEADIREVEVNAIPDVPDYGYLIKGASGININLTLSREMHFSPGSKFTPEHLHQLLTRWKETPPAPFFTMTAGSDPQRSLIEGSAL